MPRKSKNIEDKNKGSQVSIPPGFILRHTLQGHSEVIYRIAWSPIGDILASPSRDKTIRLWDAQTGQPLLILKGHSDPVWSVAWSPDGRSVLYRRDEVVLLNLPTQSDRKPKVLLDSPFMKGGFRFSPDGRWLAYSFTESSPLYRLRHRQGHT